MNKNTSRFRNLSIAALLSCVSLLDANAQLNVKKGSGTTYDMTQSQVEKSLNSLSRSYLNYLEDAWLFHKDKLTDIGIAEEDSIVIPNPVLLNSLIINIPKGDTITLYHIHPDRFKNDRSAPPSVYDILNHAKISTQYKDKVIIDRMLDGRGCWEYSLSKDLTDKIIKDEKVQAKSINFTIDLYLRRAWNYPDSSDSKKIITYKYNPSSIDKYIKSMKEIGIYLKFTPLNSSILDF